MPTGEAARRAAVCLYAALVADVSLNLIGAKARILVEGRFSEAEVFVRALASVRTKDRIYMSNAHTDVSYGALRLIDPRLPAVGALVQAKPLEVALDACRDAWAREFARAGAST